ncbi:MAG: hypothetical protein AAGK21_00760 [Bacteroidota bacterium]
MVAWLRAILPAVAATLGMAALLGALVTGTLASIAEDPLAPEALLRRWMLFSGLCLPLGFVFGVPLLAVARSLRRGRADRAAD